MGKFKEFKIRTCITCGTKSKHAYKVIFNKFNNMYGNEYMCNKCATLHVNIDRLISIVEIKKKRLDKFLDMMYGNKDGRL